MERKKLKQILLNFYSVPMSNMLLRGQRKPSYKMICKLQSKHKIPFTAWKDIKSYTQSIQNEK